MSIKLVAFDLDGTILDHENKPLQAALETVQSLIDRGVHVASISGRSISKSQQPFKTHTTFASSMLVGGYNGALALDREKDGKRRVLHQQRMPEGVYGEIVDLLAEREINFIYCHLDVDDEGLHTEDYVTIERDATVDYMTIQTGTEFVIDSNLVERLQAKELPVPPKLLILPGPERREAVLADLKERYGEDLYLERTDSDRIETMHPEVDKARALAAIAGACGVDVSETMAVGDGSNDLSMLVSAGRGVLLGNADQTTQEAAADLDVLLGPSFSEEGFSRAVSEAFSE